MWFKKKKTPDTPKLFGVSLDNYHYLGYSEFNYVDHNEVVTTVFQSHYFVHKTSERRKVAITGNASESYKKHNFYIKHVALWEAGEGQLYDCVSTQKSYRSDYIKEYMQENYSCVWDNKKRWWATSEDSKYESAVDNQKKSNTNNTVEGTVVKVDFKKGKNSIDNG